MANGATDLGEQPRPTVHRLPSLRVLRDILTGDRKGHLENGYDRKIAPRPFVGDGVDRDGDGIADVLCRLHAVVVIHRIVGELSQGYVIPFLVEGFDYQIVIDPVDFAGIQGAIGPDCDLTEMESLGHQLPADGIAGPPRLFESLVSDLQEIESHLPGQQLYKLRAEHSQGVPFVAHILKGE